MSALLATIHRHRQALLAMLMIAIVLLFLWTARGALPASRARSSPPWLASRHGPRPASRTTSEVRTSPHPRGASLLIVRTRSPIALIFPGAAQARRARLRCPHVAARIGAARGAP